MKKCSFLTVLALLLLLVLALPVQAAADNSWMQQDPILPHVTDEAGILTENELARLEAQAEEISAQYEVGIYMVVVNDYRDYSSQSVFDAAIQIYQMASLGLGEGKDGLLLFLSMDDRDYYLVTYGDIGNYVFNDEGREIMTEYFLDDFADDNWYAGFADYVSWSGKYLQAASDGEPYSYDNAPKGPINWAVSIAIILLVPLAVAGIVVLVLTLQMKSVAKATEASAYALEGLQLSQNRDIFTHTTETRRKIEHSNNGGGTSTSRSGGFSGTGGKF